MRLTVNGVRQEVPAGLTLDQLVGTVTTQASGVAAAVNGEVLPRRSWPATPLREGDQVEVVTAVQGG